MVERRRQPTRKKLEAMKRLRHGRSYLETGRERARQPQKIARNELLPMLKEESSLIRAVTRKLFVDIECLQPERHKL